MAILFGTVPFKIVRGTRWDDDITLTDLATSDPVDLTGITGITMRLREDINSAIVLEISTAASSIVILDAAAGKIGIRVTSTLTRTLPENDNDYATYIYDAIIERTAGEYEPAIGGYVVVVPQVTRPWGTT